MPATKSKEQMDKIVKGIAEDLSSKDRSPQQLMKDTLRKSGSHKEALDSLEKLRTGLEDKLTELKSQTPSKENNEYTEKLKKSIQQVEKAQIYYGDPKYAKDPKAGKENFDDFKQDKDKADAQREQAVKGGNKKHAGSAYEKTNLPEWVKNFGLMAKAINEKLGIDEKARGLLFDAKQSIKDAFKKDTSKGFDAAANKKDPSINIEDTPANTQVDQKGQAPTPQQSSAASAPQIDASSAQASQAPQLTAASDSANTVAPVVDNALQQAAAENAAKGIKDTKNAEVMKQNDKEEEDAKQQGDQLGLG